VTLRHVWDCVSHVAKRVTILITAPDSTTAKMDNEHDFTYRSRSSLVAARLLHRVVPDHQRPADHGLEQNLRCCLVDTFVTRFNYMGIR